MYALAGILRAGAGRASYHSPKVFIEIAGSASRTRVRKGSLTIRDVLNERPNTALMAVDTIAPSKGDEVIVTLGTINRLSRLFAGHALTPTQIYEGKPANIAWHLSCTDYTWVFNSRQVTKRYFSTSVSDIAIDLIETYAPTFSTAGIALGLDTIDEITFTNTDLADCLTQLVRRIGGYWKVDYRKRVHLWVTSTLQAPTTLTGAVGERFRNIQFTEDLSGVITRVNGEGGGANALATVAVGETIIPVEEAEWYNEFGGTIVSGPQRITYSARSLGGGGALVGPGAAPSSPPALVLASGAGVDSGAHDYAVTFVTGAGESLPSPIASITTGSLSAPSSAPTIGSASTGVGPAAGDHDYEVTFVTSSGETTPGPSVQATVSGPVADPTVAPTVTVGASSAFPSWGSAADVYFKYSYSTNVTSSDLSTITAPSPASNGLDLSDNKADITLPYSDDPAVKWIVISFENVGGAFKTYASSGVMVRANVPGGGNLVASLERPAGITTNIPTTSTAGAASQKVIPLTNIPLGPAAVTSRKIYRRFNGAGTFKLVTTIANNTATTFSDTVTNASLGADAPSSNTATVNQVSLSSIPIGGSGTTQRKIYRTAVGGSQLKLQSTIADNTTTTATDSAADSSLGANVPTVDTSGLVQPEGQISAGSTSLIVAGTGAFSASGGWAVIGNGQQVIRYTGITDSSLTGIPASGAGAIVASISYNSTITAAPQLTGVPSTGEGSIQYAILRGDPVNIFVQRDDSDAQAALAALIGGDFDGVREDDIQDRRLSEDELIARCDAWLDKRKDARAEIRYQTQDVTTQSGALITANIPAPTSISGTFTIQEVAVASIQESPAQVPRALPWYSVVASTEHFSLEDLLRRRRAA